MARLIVPSPRSSMSGGADLAHSEISITARDRLVVAGILRSDTTLDLAPDALVNELLPHDADLVIERTDPDLLLVESRALGAAAHGRAPGNRPWPTSRGTSVAPSRSPGPSVDRASCGGTGRAQRHRGRSRSSRSSIRRGDERRRIRRGRRLEPGRATGAVLAARHATRSVVPSGRAWSMGRGPTTRPSIIPPGERRGARR